MGININTDETEQLIQENAELHKVLDALCGKQSVSTGISWISTIHNYLKQYTSFSNAFFNNVIRALKNYEEWERKNNDVR